MNIVEGSSMSGYATFSRPVSSGATRMFAEKRERLRSSIGSERSMRLYDSFEQSSRRLDIGELIYERRVAERREMNMFDDGHVSFLRERDQIQHSNITMRRLIMSDEEIRAKARLDLIEGWSGVYVDPDPGKSGMAHRDYRRLNDGLFIPQSDVGGDTVRHYYEQDSPSTLSLAEKLDAYKTISVVRRMLGEEGEDPTSLNGGYF